jgi:hypothetical protein
MRVETMRVRWRAQSGARRRLLALSVGPASVFVVLAACSVDQRTLRVATAELGGDSGVRAASGGAAADGSGGRTADDADANITPTDGGTGSDGSGSGPVGDGGCAHVGADGRPDCGNTLALNADFNRDVANWTEQDAFGHSAWNARDSQSRSGSGSIAITNTYQVDDDNAEVGAAAEQCIPVVPGTTYTFASQAFIPKGQPAAFGLAVLAAWFYSGSTCGGLPIENNAYTVAAADKLDTWVAVPPVGFPGGLIAPANARSMAVRLVAQKPGNLGSFQVMFDAIRIGILH